MGKSSSDFERFLYANYPDDYRRATVADVPDDVITAILSKHSRHYEIWTQIPEWIKSAYHDRLPAELLNGNVQVRTFIESEQNKQSQSEKENKELLDYGVTLLALGYTSETVSVILGNRAERNRILQEAGGAPLSGELLERWLATRESDKQAITKDWQENSPEKYVFHLIKEFSRTEKKVGQGQADEASLTAQRQELEQQLQGLFTTLTDKNSKQKIIDYLRQQPQQAALKHLQPEAMSVLTNVLHTNGIKLKPAAENNGQTTEVKREGLVGTLKEHFSRWQKMKTLLTSKYRYQNKTLSLINPRQVADEKSDEDLDRMITLRRESKQKSA